MIRSGLTAQNVIPTLPVQVFFMGIPGRKIFLAALTACLDALSIRPADLSASPV